VRHLSYSRSSEEVDRWWIKTTDYMFKNKVTACCLRHFFVLILQSKLEENYRAITKWCIDDKIANSA
jgi:hypothetical protein